MSRISTQEIKCPHCGEKIDFVYWESINVTLNPDMKERVLNGEAFRCECPHCNQSFGVEYPTLYHDMDKHFMIHCNPMLMHEETRQMMRTLLQLEMLPDYRQRFTLEQNEMKEKILIFENDLDDRIIEIMKLFIFVQIDAEKEVIDNEELFLDRYKDGGLCFVLLKEGKVAGSLDFPQDMYDALKEEFQESLNKEKTETINQEWALKFLAKRKQELD